LEVAFAPLQHVLAFKASVEDIHDRNEEHAGPGKPRKIEYRDIHTWNGRGAVVSRYISFGGGD
jgi:hypothetical protein